MLEMVWDFYAITTHIHTYTHTHMQQNTMVGYKKDNLEAYCTSLASTVTSSAMLA